MLAIAHFILLISSEKNAMTSKATVAYATKNYCGTKAGESLQYGRPQ